MVNFSHNRQKDEDKEAKKLLKLLNSKPIVLVGMMGAGKTTIGRRLANRLGIKFIDSDVEIEQAAGMSIVDFFSTHGEEEFRKGEAKVIRRILEQKNIVLASGGGAFISEQTRNIIKQRAFSIWIRAEFDVLFARISKRPTRPLLQTENPQSTLKKLIKERYPLYQKADIAIISEDVPHEIIVSNLISKAINYLQNEKLTKA